MDASTLLSDLRSQLDSLLAGRDAARDLERWFTDHVQDVADCGDAAADELINAAWLSLAEYQAKDITRDEFLDDLRGLSARLDSRQPAA